MSCDKLDYSTVNPLAFAVNITSSKQIYSLFLSEKYAEAQENNMLFFRGNKKNKRKVDGQKGNLFHKRDPEEFALAMVPV